MGREIRQKTYTFLTIAANGAAAIALTLYQVYLQHQKTSIAFLSVATLALFVVPLVLGRMTIKSEAISVRLQERQRALAMFSELAHGFIELDPAHDLRVTLLEVDSSQQTPRLRQSVRCTCKGQASPGSTSMTIHQGVAGRCYLKATNVTLNIDSHSVEDFTQHMVDLGFPEAEARQFKPRGAYLCSPVMAGNDVVAVLCLDAKTPAVFTPDHTEAAEWLTPFFAKFLTGPEERM